MNTLYLGKLECADPLYEILSSNVCPAVKDPTFHVNSMAARGVYKYTEETTRIATIGKFFRLNDPKHNRILRIKGEYDNLQTIRGYGFDTSPNYVVRPISRDNSIGLALIEEFIHGKDLDHYFRKAIYEGDAASLKKKLSKLASFLFVFHKTTEKKETVELDSVNAYFQKILNTLCQQEIIAPSDKNEYLKLMDQWLGKTLLQKTKNGIVHGDSTPTNFIFTDRGDVVAIDLERMKNADPVFDIGMVCGEIKHAFLWRTGKGYEAEPFIRHFFESYSSHFRDRKKAFREITLRNSFYMAMTELRIARNDYLDLNYRKRLADEALRCLKGGLKIE
jgi:thiamine kinase-like enzyme